MQGRVSVSFLGTCSGEVVDCAEGTQLQLQRVAFPKLSRITKVFITHLHIDHCMGLLPLMNSAMRSTNTQLENSLRLELYGPAGLRKLIRTNLELTRPNLMGKYRAHELVTREDPVTSCEEHVLHAHELAGRDILCDNKGQWLDFECDDGFAVDAGPLIHRVSCLGYIFKECARPVVNDEYLHVLDNVSRDYLPTGVYHPRSLLRTLTQGQSVTLTNGTVIEPPPFSSQGRKIVILGDTSDPSGVEDLSQNATLLVHESTNAYLPLELDKRAATRTPQVIRETAISRGHSTPDMAGAFARRVNAKQLYMNHFSARFPDAGPPIKIGGNHASNGSQPTWQQLERERKFAVMREIERQASEAWGMGNAVCARDLLVVEVDPV